MEPKPGLPEPPKKAPRTHPIGGPATSEETIAQVRAISPVCMISFSRGKDAIAAYLNIRDKFERVVPYTYYVVPGLEFVEESLLYFEAKMGCHIKRFPAPAFWNWIKYNVYQPPNRVNLNASMDIQEYTQDDLQLAVCADEGLDPETTYNAIGTRAADSMMRALHFQKNGSVNHARRTFSPVWDWGKERLMATIRASGWKLPIDYTIWTSSFDGLYLNYLYQIKKHFPRDYQRILHFFPLAELEIYRYEASLK